MRICVLLCGLLLAGCAVNAIEVSEADNGKAIMANPGQTVAVTLDENPMTGYRWQAELAPPGAWRLVSSLFSPPPPGRPGAHGTRTWRLEAAQGGKARLRFVLARPWSGDAALKQLEFELVAR